MGVLLETKGLTRHFGRIRAVEEVGLRIEEGDVYGFLGVNGAGKTTTIRLILRLIRPTRGEVFLFGKNTRGDFLEILRRIGALIELPAYYGYLTAYRNLEVLRLATGGIPSRRIVECLEMVGLADRMHDKVRTFSQGMRQRLAIAMALLSRPRFVILDEPLNGLDPQGINHIREMIRDLNRKEGVTFLISSHLLHEVELSCNRVGIIKEGRLILQDTLQNILSETAVTVRIECAPADRALELLREWGPVEQVPEDGSIRLQCDPARHAEANAALVHAGIRVSAFAPQRRTLEDFFLSK